MISLIKGFFGGLWGYVALIGAVLSGLFVVYRKGVNDAEKDALEALRESEAEAHRVMTEGMHREKEAVDEANKRTRRRDFD